jgi:hypothetical protein
VSAERAPDSRSALKSWRADSLAFNLSFSRVSQREEFIGRALEGVGRNPPRFYARKPLPVTAE